MKTILVPTDFSKNSNDSLQYAIQFVNEKEHKLIFFHSFYDSGLDNLKDAKNINLINLEVANLTDKLNQELKNSYSLLNIPFSLNNIEVIIKFGKNVVQLINQTVSEKQIDLIIIATHSTTGLKAELFGSNTVKLIDTSTVPVLAIKMGYKFEIIKKIIYSTDLLNTKKELEQLNSINEIFTAELSIVYFDNGIEKTKSELNNLKLIEETGLDFIKVKVNVGSHLVTEISEFVKNKRNSAVCLFHSPKKRLVSILLGSNTDEFALHLNAPLLSLNK